MTLPFCDEGWAHIGDSAHDHRDPSVPGSLPAGNRLHYKGQRFLNATLLGILIATIFIVCNYVISAFNLILIYLITPLIWGRRHYVERH